MHTQNRHYLLQGHIQLFEVPKSHRWYWSLMCDWRPHYVWAPSQWRSFVAAQHHCELVAQFFGGRIPLQLLHLPAHLYRLMARLFHGVPIGGFLKIFAHGINKSRAHYRELELAMPGDAFFRGVLWCGSFVFRRIWELRSLSRYSGFGRFWKWGGTVTRSSRVVFVFLVVFLFLVVHQDLESFWEENDRSVVRGDLWCASGR